MDPPAYLSAWSSLTLPERRILGWFQEEPLRPEMADLRCAHLSARHAGLGWREAADIIAKLAELGLILVDGPYLQAVERHRAAG